MARKVSDNPYMSSTYNKMCRVLRYVEKSMDKEEFDAERFTPSAFDMGDVIFYRVVQLLLDDGLLRGVTVEDNGPPDEFDALDDKPYQRRTLRFDTPTVTIAGLRFLAENSVLAKAFGAVKGIGDLAGLVSM